MVRLQVLLHCILAVSFVTRSTKLLVTPLLCQFSFKRLFARSNVTLSVNATASRLNDNLYNHTAYIAVLEKRLSDAESEVMCCRQELITLRVNVTEAQRELGQCKFQNTCYEQQLFDAEDRISYLEEAMYNMTINYNATLVTSDTSQSNDSIAVSSVESTDTSAPSASIEKLYHSGGATPKKKSDSKPSGIIKSPVEPKKSLLQRIFGRRKPSAVIKAASSPLKDSKAVKSVQRQSASKAAPTKPVVTTRPQSSAPVVAMSEADAAEKHWRAKSDALMLTLTLKQRAIEDLSREVEQYAARDRGIEEQQRHRVEDLVGQVRLLREQLRETETEKEKLLLVQRQQEEEEAAKKAELQQQLQSQQAEVTPASSSEVLELREDLAMKDVEVMQLRKRLELLQTTSDAHAKQYAADVEELQQRIQSMIDEKENSTAAGNMANSTVPDASISGGVPDEIVLLVENNRLKTDVVTANITIEFLQQQLAQLRQEHSKQHSNLKNVITQLEATSGYKPPLVSGGENNIAAGGVAVAVSGVSSTSNAGDHKQQDNLVLALAKCLSRVVEGIKRCLQRILNYLHDL